MYNIESYSITSTDQKWGEFARDHLKAKPELPSSDFTIPRGRKVFTAPVAELRTSNKNDSTHSSHHSGFRLKSSGVAVDLSTSWNKGWSLSKGLNDRPDCCEIDVEEDIFSHSRRLESARSICTPGVSLKTRTHRSDPFTWQVSGKDQDRLVTVHQRTDSSPGPKYNLQSPPVMKGSKGPPSQLFVSIKKEITFGKDPRMPDEPYRSPGPVYYPPHKKGLLSQNQLGSPDLNTYRKLHGSIYYNSFNSPCTDVTYDTTKKFEFESNRTAVRGPTMHPITVPVRPAIKSQTLRNFNQGKLPGTS